MAHGTTRTPGDHPHDGRPENTGHRRVVHEPRQGGPQLPEHQEAHGPGCPTGPGPHRVQGDAQEVDADERPVVARRQAVVEEQRDAGDPQGHGDRVILAPPQGDRGSSDGEQAEPQGPVHMPTGGGADLENEHGESDESGVDQPVPSPPDGDPVPSLLQRRRQRRLEHARHLISRGQPGAHEEDRALGAGREVTSQHGDSLAHAGQPVARAGTASPLCTPPSPAVVPRSGLVTLRTTFSEFDVIATATGPGPPCLAALVSASWTTR